MVIMNIYSVSVSAENERIQSKHAQCAIFAHRRNRKRTIHGCICWNGSHFKISSWSSAYPPEVSFHVTSFTGSVRLSRVLFVLRRHYFFLEAVSALLLLTCIRTAVPAPCYPCTVLSLHRATSAFEARSEAGQCMESDEKHSGANFAV